jgi:hypothetical protein
MAQAKKISGTNMVERVARTSKANAKAVAGAMGHSVAALILKQANETGDALAALAEKVSRKELLTRLLGFPNNAEHLAFRDDMQAELDAIKARAAQASMSLNDWCDSQPKDNYKRVEVAMWLMMSRAVEHGFSGSAVDMNLPWNELRTKARAHLDNVGNSTGSAGPKTTNAGVRQKKAGKKPTAPQAKMETFVKANIIDEKTLSVKADVNLAKTVGTLLVYATVAQCDEVIAECVRIRDAKIKVEAELKEKATAQAKKAGDMAKGKPETTPAAPSRTVTDEKISRAQASTGRGKNKPVFDPETQSKLRDGTIVDVKRHTRKEAKA